MNNLTSSNEEIDMIKDVIKDFGVNEITPVVSDIESNSEIPSSILKQVSELGLYGMLGSSEYNGAETSFSTFIHGMLELAKYSPALSALLMFQNVFSVQPITQFGSTEQKESILGDLNTGNKLGTALIGDDGGTLNIRTINTEAMDEGDSLSISGTKKFAFNGAIADYFIVLCNIGTNPCFVLVEKDNQGVSIGNPIDTVGLRGNKSVPVSFYSCNVPKTNIIGSPTDTNKIIHSIQESFWMGIGAISNGVMQSALSQAIKYSNERQQFSKPISSFEAIQNKLSNISTDIEVSLAMLEKACKSKDTGEDILRQSAMTKIFTTEKAQQNTKLALLVHGGYGFIKDYPIERTVRDAETLKTICDSNDDLRLIVSKPFVS